MNVKILLNTVSFILLITLCPNLCGAANLQKADTATYLDDTEEFLFPQFEKQLDDAENQSIINPWTYKINEDVLSILSDLSTPWSQVNLEGFDPVFYWRGANNYAVIDDSFVEYKGLLYAGTDNPIYGPEIWAYNGDG